MSIKPIPDGFHTVTPHITIKGASALMQFFRDAFNATERSRTQDAAGRIANAEMVIGDSIVMIADASEKYPPMPSAYYLYVPDTDATYHRAIKAGAISLMEPADQFYGDRNAGIQDPSGNQWWIATHVEDVSPEEMKRRTEEWQATTH
jgi:PhnB protein